MFGSLLFFLVRTLPELRMVLGQSLFPQGAACGCESMLLFSLHPYFYSFLFLFAAVSITLLVLFVTKILLLWRATRHTRQQLCIIDRSTIIHEKKLYTVLTVRDTVLFSYVTGVLQPTIVISQAIQQQLTAEEYHAVLLHEVGHIALWHVCKKYLLFAFVDTFFFLPGVKALKKSLECAQEIAADECALHSIDRATLLSAFTRTVTKSHTPSAQALSHFSFGDMRLCYLLKQELHFPHLRLFCAALLVCIGLASASGVFAQGLDLLGVRSTSPMGHTVKMCYEEMKQEAKFSALAPGMLFCPAVFIEQQTILEVRFLTSSSRSTILYSR